MSDNNSSHKIRLWQFEDLKAIAELERQSFSDSWSDGAIYYALDSIEPVEAFALVIPHDEEIIGYKIGYELKADTFYSWLGGVAPKYQKHGIGTKLMEMQHQWIKENGYTYVQTKTMNKWRSMLILNIKNGFDVIDTYIDKKGLQKIVLEKT